jgi:alkylation response protein AidB-like acyl-CoA dehydrogenase
VLNGDKYYSTGTLYADWIAVSAQRLDAAGESSRVIALLPKAAEGVRCDDDWRGFGQRLSASGTTRFENALVDADHVLTYPRDRATPMTAYFQLIHLATLAGIARAIERDAVDFVRKRKRVYSHGSGGTAADDPLVQQVIGQLASAAFAAAAIVRSAAQPLGDIDRLRQAGQPIPESLIIEAELRTAKAHPVVADLVLNAATHLFDVGGASALQEDVRLDRHWRNARTLASHNPSIYKSRLVGDHAISNTRPSFYWSVGTSGG